MRILHLLNWNLNDINSSLERIYDQGFEAIQINPVQPLKEEGNIEWWMSYQPCGFRIGNQYGCKEDLIRLCNKANFYGIKIIADVVLNHMAGKSDGSLYPHEKVDECLKNNPEYWKNFENVSNWQDRKEVITKCLGLPGLNVSNHDVQDIIIDFLNELIDCGINGFRFDAAKNIGLPSEGYDFWPRIIYCLKKYGLFLYGEIIFANKELIDCYCRYFNVLSNSFGSNDSNLVAFVESHDSFHEFGYTKNIPSHVIANDYKGLTNNFDNTLFFARPYDNTWEDNQIKEANKNGKRLVKTR